MLREDQAELKLLTIPEAARTLTISRSTIYELIREGELPVIRIGGSVRISVTAINTFIQERTHNIEQEVA